MTTRGTWRGLWGSVAILAWAGLATAQTSGTERVQRLSASQRVVIGATTFGATSPLQVVGLPSKTSQTACAWLDGSGNVFTGACPTGTVSSVGLTMPGIFSVSGSPITTSGTLAVSLATQSANLVFAGPTSGGAAAPTFRSLVKADHPAAVVFDDDANTFSAAGTALTVTNNAAFGGIASSLIPSLTDTYNLGSSTKLWNEGFLAQLNAVIFAEQTATLFGGWSVIGKNAGSFPARVASSDTTINFGKAMTVGHFIAIRAHDEGGSLPTAEHLQVGSLVSGTTYNVTRNLSGLGAKTWPAGTSYLVSGTTGDGRIELRAYSTPQISILTQGATYNAQTEQVRIGYLDGMPGMAAGKIGLYIGDLSTSGMAYYDGALQIRGSVTITGGSGYANLSDKPTLGSVAALNSVTLGTHTSGNYAGSSSVGGSANNVTTIGSTAATTVESYANTAGTWRHGSDTTKIDGGDIYADSITAGQIATMQLSAISADLGTITAGTITGATIRTAASGARAEMNSSSLRSIDSSGNTLVTLDGTGILVNQPTGGSIDLNRGYRFGTNSGLFGYTNGTSMGYLDLLNQGPTNTYTRVSALSTSGASGGLLATTSGANVTTEVFAAPYTGAGTVQFNGTTIKANNPIYPGYGYNFQSTGWWQWNPTYTNHEFSHDVQAPGLMLNNWQQSGASYRTVCTGASSAGAEHWLYFGPSSTSCDSSSLRYKTNVAPAAFDFSRVLDLRPVTFEYKTRLGTPQFGLIAEDVDALGLEPLVARNDDGMVEAVNYEKIALYLIPVVKAQQAQIEALERRLSALEAGR